MIWKFINLIYFTITKSGYSKSTFCVKQTWNETVLLIIDQIDILCFEKSRIYVPYVLLLIRLSILRWTFYTLEGFFAEILFLFGKFVCKYLISSSVLFSLTFKLFWRTKNFLDLESPSFVASIYHSFKEITINQL